MSAELYRDIVGYVESQTGFEKKPVPDVDIESTCFVSYDRGYVLHLRLENEEISAEYGLGLANSETSSGVEYIRTVDVEGVASVNSLEDVKSFLSKIPSRN